MLATKETVDTIRGNQRDKERKMISQNECCTRVSEVLNPPFTDIFKYDVFNEMQSVLLEQVLSTNVCRKRRLKSSSRRYVDEHGRIGSNRKWENCYS